MKTSSIYQKLVSYIRKEIGVNIISDNADFNLGAYRPDTDTIVINPKLHKQGQYCASTLLHEFGHYIIFRNASKRYINKANKAYNDYADCIPDHKSSYEDNGKRISKTSCNTILTEERNAWSIGRKLFVRMFPDEKDFLTLYNKDRKESIDDYKMRLKYIVRK